MRQNGPAKQLTNDSAATDAEGSGGMGRWLGLWLAGLLLVAIVAEAPSRAGAATPTLSAAKATATSAARRTATAAAKAAKTAAAEAQATSDARAAKTATAQARKAAPTATPKTAAAAKAPASAATGADAPNVGNARSTFDKAYGAPDPASSKLPDIASYLISGFGAYNVAFSDNKAFEIVMAADRMDHQPLTDWDDKDWSPSTADSRVRAVLPSDTTCDKADATTTSEAIVRLCHSATLARAFSADAMQRLGLYGNPGDMTVSQFFDSQGDISVVDVALGVPQGQAVGGGSGAAASAPTPTKAAGSAGSGPRATTAPSGNRLVCANFATQKDAQAVFETYGGATNPAVSSLDGDKDGIACEELPAG